jgi:amino acid transporter
MPLTPADSEPLLRRLTTWGIWLLVVNGMIGAGIFGLPGEAARLTGTFSPYVFVLCALIVLPVLLCFAELASSFRGTGGPMRYAGTAFGPFLGFQTGWTFYVARAVAFAANVNLLVDSAAFFVTGANRSGIRLAVIFGVCIAFTWVNVIGATHAMRSLAGLTFLKFLPLVVLVGAGLVLVGSAIPAPASLTVPPGADIGAATLLLIYAYVGFESAVVPAGEARNPARDMPRALILGLAVVTLLYVLVQAVSVAALPGLEQSDSPLLDVAARLLGPAGAVLLMTGVLASVGGNLVGAIFSTPRITYALARDGSLPAWFGRVHPQFGTPANSVICYGAIAFALAAFGSFAWLAAMNVLVRVLMYMLSIAALPVLRRRFVDVPGRFILPGGLTIPVIAMALCVWLLTQVSHGSYVVTGAFLAAGSALYWVARRERRAALVEGEGG